MIKYIKLFLFFSCFCLGINSPIQSYAWTVTWQEIYGENGNNEIQKQWLCSATFVLSIHSKEGLNGLIDSIHEFIELLNGKHNANESGINEYFPTRADKLRYIYTAQQAINESVKGMGEEFSEWIERDMKVVFETRKYCFEHIKDGRYKAHDLSKRAMEMLDFVAAYKMKNKK